MKALLFHCRNYAVKFDSFSNRPSNISPEEVKEREQKCEDCVAAFVTVESGDLAQKVSSELAGEIAKMCKEVGKKRIVIVPFAHLSKNLADSETSLKTFEMLEEDLAKDFEVVRAHFGSNKSLLLDVFGHPGNVRFREF